MDVKLNLADPLLLIDPSSAQTLVEKALRVPPEMVLQIASGLDTPEDIAKRYGFSEEEFAALSTWVPFQQEVAKVRAELEKSGFDFVIDSRVKAKELSNVLFTRAMLNDTTFGQVHDAFRTFTEFADLKPKPNPLQANPGQTQPAFSINIVFNDAPHPTAAPGDSLKHAVDITPAPDLPAPLARRNPFVIDVTSST